MSGKPCELPFLTGGGVNVLQAHVLRSKDSIQFLKLPEEPIAISAMNPVLVATGKFPAAYAGMYTLLPIPDFAKMNEIETESLFQS